MNEAVVSAMGPTMEVMVGMSSKAKVEAEWGNEEVSTTILWGPFDLDAGSMTIMPDVVTSIPDAKFYSCFVIVLGLGLC